MKKNTHSEGVEQKVKLLRFSMAYSAVMWTALIPSITDKVLVKVA